ncbi:MAG: DUF4157 domain-containing protein [Ferruginibacter sp.]|nr:DUF4157 domain-containing protein [Ferruginibacter sp.]
MFSSAEKTNRTSTTVQQKAQQQTFFRKAGEESFFGSKEQPSFFNAPIQAKLSISSPDDPQEKEADAVADSVMRMPDPATSVSAGGEEKIDKKEDEEVHPKIETPVISRKISCKEEGEEIQAKQSASIFRMPGENDDRSFSDASSAGPSTSAYINCKQTGLYHSDIIQRSGRGPPTGSIPFEQSLSSSKGGGSALPGDTRQFMESRFNADFSGVRIHTGATAQSMSSSIHAQAFAHGNDIYFNEGKFSPHTQSGATLLAHELTHTIQQGASPAKGTLTVAPKLSIARKNIIQRSGGGVPAQLTNAVEKAKTVEGQIDANKPGPDGFRTGWGHLVEIFKTTFGEEKIVSGGGGTSVQGAVAEQDIKKKRTTEGLVADGNRPGHAFTGERDAMPSWCGIFTFWALNKSGVPMPKWKLGERIIKPEAARAPGSMPMPGDIAYRNAFSHYAIVESVSGNTVRTVNGNTAGEDNLGGQVQTKDHPLDNWTAFFNPLLVMTGSLGSGEGPANQKPKTLDELRKEGLNINRKEENEEHETGSGGETEIQAKPEMSNWHVDAKGSLNIAAPIVQKAEDDKELQKKEGEEQEEEKISLSPVKAIQKKVTDDLEAENAGSVETDTLSVTPISLQTKTQNENSSLKNNTNVPVQQNAAIHERGPPVQLKAETGTIQCSVIDDALEYTSLGALMDCVDITDADATSACLLGKASEIAMHIPGYKALRVVLNRDPITGDYVERNGHNFLEAAFDIMPGGELLYQKLDEQQQLDAAAAWIDGKITDLESIVDSLFSNFDQFWNGLGITDFGSPMDVLREGAGIVLGFIESIISFAVDAALELLEMVKDFLLEKIVEFIQEHTTAFPLLCLILGENPITKEPVDPTGTNILNALLELGGEEGRIQRDQMMDTGTFEKVAGYIDEGISVFSGLYDAIILGFNNIWDIVSIDALMDPVGTFTQIYNIFADPVIKVLDFVGRVIEEILKLVKEVLFKRISEEAKKVRGYFLVTLLIGTDPFTGEAVDPSVENIIHGFMSLMDGGEEQFQQMKESGAIARTVAKVDKAVKKLNMTLESIIQLFTDLWNSFTFSDFLTPIPTFQRIIATFGEPIGRLVAFVVEIVKIVITVILEIMNFPFDTVNNIITRSMAAFHSIKKDPIGFLKNLLRAIKQGFIQFFDNIVTHLINGVVGWLMSELKDAGIPELTDFSLQGVIGWVLEVLGLTMEKIWEKLAAHPRIGPARVARLRSMINTLEGIWTFIKDVQERGMAAIWDKIQEQLSNLWNVVLDAVKNWIMETIITQVTVKLLGMLDPTGIMAVINSCIAIYSAIQSFIKYLREMLEILNAFVNGVADIAEGNVTTAANYLESTMGRAMPIVIGFLANQVGLGGVGRRVGEMIESVRTMVDEALTWLVNKAVDTGMSLLDRVMGTGGSGDPVAGVKQSLHQAETPYLSNGAIRHEEAQTVAQTVATQNSSVVSSIQVQDGGNSWNYNIIQRSEEPGPRKEEVAADVGVSDLYFDRVNDTYYQVTAITGERCSMRLLNITISSVTYDIATVRENTTSGSWQKLMPGGSAPVRNGDLIKVPYKTGSYLAYITEPFGPGVVTYQFRGQNGKHGKNFLEFVEMLSRGQIYVIRVDAAMLRGETPSAALRAWAQGRLAPTDIDPAFPSLTVDSTAQADHIVPFSEIIVMTNFDLLTVEQQIAVLNLQSNFVALSQRANGSKGSRSYSQWTRHADLGIDVDASFRRQMMRREVEARQAVEAKIAEYLAMNLSPEP